MKKLIAVVGLLAVVAGSAAAQGGGGGGGGGGGRMGGGRGTPEQQDSAAMARAFNGITLDAATTAKAKAIITASREATAGLDRQAPDFNDKRMAATAKRNADLKALLTKDEDKTKFDANTAAGAGRRGGGL